MTAISFVNAFEDAVEFWRRLGSPVPGRVHCGTSPRRWSSRRLISAPKLAALRVSMMGSRVPSGRVAHSAVWPNGGGLARSPLFRSELSIHLD